jgi:hypothetical protein
VLSFVTSFYGNGETKFPDKVQAEHCLARLVRDCVFLQISVNVHLNMSEYENGQLPLAKRTIRSRISSERWEQIKVAYAAGIGLREIARKMHIPEGTVFAHAKRHGWTQQIQVATQQQSDAITPVQSVPQSLAAILSERKDRTKLDLSKFAAEAAEQAAEASRQAGDCRKGEGRGKCAWNALA